MKTVLVAAMLMTLTGCVSFGAKPPKQLLTLNATSQRPVGTTRTASSGETITVYVPVALPPISSTRVPVYEGDNAVAYVKDALWVDAPARQFQRLLSETVAATTGRVVLDIRQYTADPGLRIQGTLQRFGVEASAQPQAVVVYDAMIMRSGGVVDSRRFEARAPVAAIEAVSAGSALSVAANDVAAQVAAWIKG
jgi:cholesterol transport system auxiliary component